jgi:predicted AlkP superfamily phosphohydrolase/phosphomutase
MVDPVLVKGVIFTNKKADLNGASILDICPTILRAFGIAKVDGIKGRDLFRADSDE